MSKSTMFASPHIFIYVPYAVSVKSLPDDVTKTVACSIISSQLDYCNALYYNLSSVNLAKLQRVQNTLARFVLR